MAYKQPPLGRRARHSKFKDLIPRAIELRKTMDLSWRETAEVLGRELDQEIPHNSLFKAAKAWLFRQQELEKWPDVEAASKAAKEPSSPIAKVISKPMGLTDPPLQEWSEDSAQTMSLPTVKIRKPANHDR